MNTKFLASLALALSLLTPSCSAAAPYDAGALQVEQVSDKGPALVFIPGLASGPWVWTDTVSRLRGRYTIYLLTLPGFDGRKPVPGTTIESLSRDLAVLIESRSIRKPVLVGHSLGGTLSLAFATEHSDLIAGVVAVDGLPVFPGTERITGDRSALGEGVRAQFAGQTPEQFAQGQQAYMKRIGSVDEATAMKLAALSSRSDVGADRGLCRAGTLALDLRPRLANGYQGAGRRDLAFPRARFRAHGPRRGPQDRLLPHAARRRPEARRDLRCGSAPLRDVRPAGEVRRGARSRAGQHGRAGIEIAGRSGRAQPLARLGSCSTYIIELPQLFTLVILSGVPGSTT